MPGAVFLEGDQVELKTVEEDDLEFLREGVNHPDVRLWMSNRRPKNLEDEKDFFEEQISSDDDSVHLLITRDDERLGLISLYEKGKSAERKAEIGIWVHPEYHGNGYGTEAAELLTAHGFEELNYHKIYARAYEENKASQRVWEKLGFEREGTLRDHTYGRGEYRDVIYFGILEEEWE